MIEMSVNEALIMTDASLVVLILIVYSLKKHMGV
jgi:hypothetical protein